MLAPSAVLRWVSLSVLLASSVVNAQIAPPVLTFTPDPALVTTTGSYLTYADPGTVTVGTLRVTGQAAMRVVVQTDGAPAAETFTSPGSTISVPVRLTNSFVGSPRTVKVEAVYSEDTRIWTYNEYVFQPVPRAQTLALAPPETAASGVKVMVPANFGTRVGGSLVYDRARAGKWVVSLHQVQGDGTLTPVSDAQYPPPEGAMTFKTRLPAGSVQLRAEAVLVDAPEGYAAGRVLSNPVNLTVHNGEPVPYTMSATPTSGPGPLTATIRVNVPADRVGDVGLVTFTAAEDGASFFRLSKSDGSKLEGVGLLLVTQEVPAGKTLHYKVKMRNRWSGADSDGAPVAVSAVEGAVATVAGAKATIVGHPVTLTASVSKVAAPEITWKAKYAGEAAVTTGEGKTFTFEAPKKGVATIEMTVKDHAAPGVVKKAVTKVTAVPAEVPKPVINGPVLVEEGKTYSWKASQKPLLPANSGSDLVTASKWVLPDGTTSTDNPVVYTMKPGDAPKIRFETSVVQYPDKVGAAEVSLTRWTYAMADFAIRTRALTASDASSGVPQLYAPGRVSYVALPVTRDGFVSMRGEQLTYQWTLPPGATMVSQAGPATVVEFAQPGRYPVHVVVTDSHGTTKTATAETMARETPPFALGLGVYSGDRFWRAPAVLRAKTSVARLPANDPLATVDYFVNGAAVGSGIVGANIAIDAPGTYTVTARASTQSGVTTEASREVVLHAAETPVCTLRHSGDGVASLAVFANCRVQRGAVTAYRWRVNGIDSSVTANNIAFPPAQLRSGIATVEVVATTDKGATGSALLRLGGGQR